MMHDDIMIHILRFAKEHGGVFKNSSFAYIADPPRSWPEKKALLDFMAEAGYFEKYKSGRIYLYRLTEKGRNYLEG